MLSDIVLFALMGLLGGLASGLFGVGGGLVFGPLLVLLKKFDTHLAIGTSIAVVIPTALVGVFRHAGANHVDWKTAAWITLFAVAGAWIGTGLSIKADPATLRRVYALFLVLVALKLSFQK